MSTTYPAVIDSYVLADVQPGKITKSAQMRLALDAVIAVETVLGVTPNGGSPTVAARIAAIEAGLGGYLQLTGGTLSGNLEFSAGKLGIQNSGAPQGMLHLGPRTSGTVAPTAVILGQIAGSGDANVFSLIGGSGNSVSAPLGVALGSNQVVTGVAGVALGSSHVVSGTNATAMGSSNVASGGTSLAGGSGSTASGSSSLAFGANAQATQAFAYAFGNTAIASGNVSFALGQSVVASGSISFAGGISTTVAASRAFAWGNGISLDANSADSAAFGSSHALSASSVFAGGSGHTISGTGSAALGQGHTLSSSYGFAAGTSHVVSGFGAAALGVGNQATGQSAVALGTGNQANGYCSFAGGTGSIAGGAFSIVFGNKANDGGFNGSAVFSDSQGVTTTADQSGQFKLRYQNGFKLVRGGGANNVDGPNYAIKQDTVNTTDATQTVLQAVPTTAGSSAYLEARVVARRTGGLAGANGDSFFSRRWCQLKNIGGVVTIANQNSAEAENFSDQGWSLVWVVNGTSVELKVTGAVNNDITWDTSTQVQQRF